MKEKMKTWEDFFESLKEKEYAKKLHEFLLLEYKEHICYPPKDKIFYAFKKTPLSAVKVVIIGQDPYHEPNQAMGLAFSVPNETTIPPSLLNIYKELALEYDCEIPKSGDLTHLAAQGVLLLNASLTVRKSEPLSHNIPEYKTLLKDIFSLLNEINRPIVFLLWGANAQKLKAHLSNKNHLILEAVHPSPLSANRGGWFGNDHFKKTNEFLKKNGLKEISWLSNSNCF